MIFLIHQKQDHIRGLNLEWKLRSSYPGREPKLHYGRFSNIPEKSNGQ